MVPAFVSVDKIRSCLLSGKLLNSTFLWEWRTVYNAELGGEILSEVRDCGKLIQSLKERGILQMCCFVILLLFNRMQMSLRRFSAIPHLRGNPEL